MKNINEVQAKDGAAVSVAFSEGDVILEIKHGHPNQELDGFCCLSIEEAKSLLGILQRLLQDCS